jgi:hypothetical protein
MVYVVEHLSEEKPKKKKWVPSIAGRWGLSFMFGGFEIFIGVNVSKIDSTELLRVKRRTITPGKGKVFNL